MKGLETLPLRVARQTETAGRIADYLASQSKVARLIYPGRDDHPQADVAKRQMSGGSTMLAMEIEGGKEAAFRFTNALEIVKISNNLGDAKSLITHPATTTHQSIGEEAARNSVSPMVSCGFQSVWRIHRICWKISRRRSRRSNGLSAAAPSRQ